VGTWEYLHVFSNALNPTSGEISKKNARMHKAHRPLGETLMRPSTAPMEFRTQAEASEFLEANPEYIRPIKILSN
jgi:hypothetical protein